MSFTSLALVVVVGLLGPLLSARASWRVPVVAGEMLGGLIIGSTGFQLVNAQQGGFFLLGQIGFGLTMVWVGSTIPLRDPRLRAALGRGLVGAFLVGICAVALAMLIVSVFHVGNAFVFAIVIASSSASLVLPMLPSVGLSPASVSQLIAQVTIANVVAVVVLPLASDPTHALHAAIGVGIIAGVSIGLAWLLRRVNWESARARVHAYSERRRFALELRITLLTLFVFAAIAEKANLSVMIAGFALGLVLSSIGEPRRLARQLFGMTEGFFGPIFYVWLGASINVRALGSHPEMIALGLALGLAAIVAHLPSRIVGLSWAHSVAAAGQMGVPVAAVTLGIQQGTLAPGEDAALLLGALITIAVTTFSIARSARNTLSVVSP